MKLNDLLDKYPEIFPERFIIKQTFGENDRYEYKIGAFECRDGWAQIIDDSLASLASWNPNPLRYMEVTQIKEKFGGLRFYYKLKDDTPEDKKEYYHGLYHGIMNMAEHRSYTTCEECGAPGNRETTRGYVNTRCDLHKLK